MLSAPSRIGKLSSVAESALAMLDPSPMAAPAPSSKYTYSRVLFSFVSILSYMELNSLNASFTNMRYDISHILMNLGVNLHEHLNASQDTTKQRQACVRDRYQVLLKKEGVLTANKLFIPLKTRIGTVKRWWIREYIWNCFRLYSASVWHSRCNLRKNSSCCGVLSMLYE